MRRCYRFSYCFRKSITEKKLSRDRDSLVREYTTYANRASNLILRIQLHFRLNNNSNKLRDAAMLPFIQDQYKTAQAWRNKQNLNWMTLLHRSKYNGRVCKTWNRCTKGHYSKRLQKQTHLLQKVEHSENMWIIFISSIWRNLNIRRYNLSNKDNFRMLIKFNLQAAQSEDQISETSNNKSNLQKWMVILVVKLPIQIQKRSRETKSNLWKYKVNFCSR